MLLGLLGLFPSLARAGGEESARRDLDARLEDALDGAEIPDPEQLLDDGEVADEDEAAEVVTDRLEAAIREASDEVAGEARVPAVPEWWWETGDEPAPGGVPAPWIPASALLAASLGRTELRARATPTARWATLAPRLVAELQWIPGSGRSAGGSATRRGGWVAFAGFEWRPARRAIDTRPEVLVSGGRAFVDDGRDRALLAARVDRAGAVYRELLGGWITRLYRRRMALAAVPAPATLRARVDQVLAIRETEAELDALTAGAVRRCTAVEDPR